MPLTPPSTPARRHIRRARAVRIAEPQHRRAGMAGRAVGRATISARLALAGVVDIVADRRPRPAGAIGIAVLEHVRADAAVLLGVTRAAALAAGLADAGCHVCAVLLGARPGAFGVAKAGIALDLLGVAFVAGFIVAGLVAAGGALAVGAAIFHHRRAGAPGVGVAGAACFAAGFARAGVVGGAVRGVAGPAPVCIAHARVALDLLGVAFGAGGGVLGVAGILGAGVTGSGVWLQASHQGALPVPLVVAVAGIAVLWTGFALLTGARIGRLAHIPALIIRGGRVVGATRKQHTKRGEDREGEPFQSVRFRHLESPISGYLRSLAHPSIFEIVVHGIL